MKKCRELLKACEIDAQFGLTSFKVDVSAFDEQHRLRCEKLIRQAGNSVKLTHGRAAKILNVYLKVRFVYGGGNSSDPIIGFIHPPIDRVLLTTLARDDVGGFGTEWRKDIKKGWSQFDFMDYQQIINRMRQHVGSAPLWTIEEYWSGYQW